MTVTREPLRREDDPLLQFSAPEDVAVEQSTDGVSASVHPVTDSIAEKDGASDVSLSVQPRKGRGRRVTIHLPQSVYDAFGAVVDAERRSMPVVLQRALEEFVAVRECEPRPYIPPMLRVEPIVDIQPKVDYGLIEQIEVRASIEERPRNSLMVRAILNYLDNHREGVE